MPAPRTAMGPSAVKVHAILKSLPLLENRKDSLIDQANNLAGVAMFASLNHQPMSHRAGTRAAQRELEALAKAGYTLARQLSRMHNEAHVAVAAALGDETRLIDFQYEVFRVTKAVYAARGKMQNAPKVVSALAGRPKKSEAAAITECAAASYEFLTGKRPTTRSKVGTINKSTQGPVPYGPFRDFLADIFAALDIKDTSAHAQAKAFVQKKGIK